MALLSPDTTKDIVFGASLIVSGIDVVAAALRKQLASALSFFVAAASTYGVFYL